MTTAAVELGAEVAPARFARLRTQQVGPGRLRVPRYVDAESATGIPGASIPVDRRLYDAQLQEPCTFFTGASGQTRCLPASLTAVFLDPACSHPVGLDLAPDPCQGDSSINFIFDAESDRLYARGARLATPPAQLFYPQDTGSCGMASYLLSLTFAYYAAGPEASVDLVTATSVSY